MSVGNNVEYLLDSNFILGVLQETQAAEKFSKKHSIDLKKCAYSAISRIELLGFAKISLAERSRIYATLNQMKRLGLTPGVEDSTIEIRKTHRTLKLPDAVILGTALHHRLQFLTFDKDLQKIFQNQKH